MRRASIFPALALALARSLAAPHAAAAGSAPSARAQQLYDSALRRIAVGSHEQRQFARAELEEASRQAPERTDVALVLGQLYLEADLLRNAREVAERATALDAAPAEAWLLAGRVWRRYWLLSSDESQRDRAIVCFARGTRREPGRSANWLELVPLLVDAGELEAAHSAAVIAARTAPGEPQAQLMLAALAQGTGDLETAARLFRAVLPRLPARQRERYEDVAPLLPPWIAEGLEDMEPVARARFAERFWEEADPDPVSELNEARLEFWARVTQACALYGTSRPGEWDVRAQYYVRFGRPEFVELNPIHKPERLHNGDWVAWTYPGLGMRLWMGSGSRYFGFGERISGWPTWAQASPDSLERRGELDALNRGWAVFHRLPPGVEPLEARLALAQFRSGDVASVLAQAEAPGGIEDRLTVEWAVLDSSFATVMRERRGMSPSACRAEEARSASFTSALPPGRYRVGVQVSDAFGRRGVVRRELIVAPPSTALAVSDLVVTCSPPAQSVSAASGVRLEPETGLFPAGGDQLNAYFEIYHLDVDAGGRARFVYDCEVRPQVQDRRGWLSRIVSPREAAPPIAVSRSETTYGELRRQFLSVPVGPLPAGRYEVEVVVRDLANDAAAKTIARFERRE